MKLVQFRDGTFGIRKWKFINFGYVYYDIAEVTSSYAGHRYEYWHRYRSSYFKRCCRHDSQLIVTAIFAKLKETQRMKIKKFFTLPDWGKPL